jgi:hypothetical protein
VSLDPYLVPFAHELSKLSVESIEKTALLARTPQMKATEKAERHFGDPDPDWGSFEKNLRSKHFRSEVSAHPMADEKLKKYVDQYGGYLTSRERVGKVKSESSNRKYSLKKVNGRIGCGCKDWQYKKSHGGGDCKHIRKFKEESLAKKVKKAFAADLLHAVTTIDQSQRRAKKNLAIARGASAMTRQARQQEWEALRKG